MGLMTGKYTYDLLSAKYGNFTAPAVKIKIGGFDILAKNDVNLKSIEVKMSLNAAGSASFVFDGGYDFKTHSMNESLKGKIKPGKVVEVELGYGKSTTSVFKGFAAEVTLDFDEDDGMTFEVTALDARRLMMTDNCPYIQFTDANYSDIVTKVMSRYRKLCRLKCDRTTDKLTSPVCQRVCDYDFIQKEIIESGKADREFFIVGNEAYFRKPQGTGTSIITLGMGTGLKSFRSTTGYLNSKIEVQGYNEMKDKAVKGKANAVSSESQDKVITAGEAVFADPECRTKSEAGDMAKSIAERLKQKVCVSEGSCVGMPEICPGRFIKIKGMDSKADKKYYITEVTHTIDMRGFTTRFYTEGCK